MFLLPCCLDASEIEFEDLKCSLTFQVLDPAALAAAQKPMIQKRESGPVRVKDTEENAGPTTTVFVGNISEKASDMLVRQLLAVSGPQSTLRGSSFIGFSSHCCFIHVCHWVIWSSLISEMWHRSELETGPGSLW